MTAAVHRGAAALGIAPPPIASIPTSAIRSVIKDGKVLTLVKTSALQGKVKAAEEAKREETAQAKLAAQARAAAEAKARLAGGEGGGSASASASASSSASGVQGGVTCAVQCCCVQDAVAPLLPRSRAKRGCS